MGGETKAVCICFQLTAFMHIIIINNNEPIEAPEAAT